MGPLHDRLSLNGTETTHRARAFFEHFSVSSLTLISEGPRPFDYAVPIADAEIRNCRSVHAN